MSLRTFLLSAKADAVALHEKLEAVAVAYGEVAVAAQEAARDASIIDKYLDGSLIGGVIEMYRQLAEQVRNNPFADQTGFARLEDIIGRFGGRDAQDVIRALRRERAGTTESTSTSTEQASQTSLGTASAQGKLSIGGRF